MYAWVYVVSKDRYIQFSTMLNATRECHETIPQKRTRIPLSTLPYMGLRSVCSTLFLAVGANHLSSKLLHCSTLISQNASLQPRSPVSSIARVAFRFVLYIVLFCHAHYTHHESMRTLH